MTHQIDYRRAVLSYLKDGGSKGDAAKLFKVSRATIYRWLNLEDLSPKPAPSRHRKIDKAKLKQHVLDYPDAFLRERAAHFGVHTRSIGRALAKLKITKKKPVAT